MPIALIILLLLISAQQTLATCIGASEDSNQQVASPVESLSQIDAVVDKALTAGNPFEVGVKLVADAPIPAPLVT